MKKNKMALALKQFGISTVVCASVIFASTLARANDSGNGAGNGGAGAESLFLSTHDQLKNWVMTTQLKDLTLPESLNREKLVFDLSTAMEKTAQAEFTDEEIRIRLDDGSESSPRTCKNIPETAKIICNKKQLIDEAGNVRFATVFHEYLGLIGVEPNQGTESQYPISSQIHRFIKEKTVKIYELSDSPVEGSTNFGSLVAELRNRSNNETLRFYRKNEQLSFVFQNAGSEKLIKSIKIEFSTDEVSLKGLKNSSFPITRAGLNISAEAYTWCFEENDSMGRQLQGYDYSLTPAGGWYSGPLILINTPLCAVLPSIPALIGFALSPVDLPVMAAQELSTRANARRKFKSLLSGKTKSISNKAFQLLMEKIKGLELK